MFEKQIAEKKKEIEKAEKSVSDEFAKQIYNQAIYDTAPLAFGMRTFAQLDDKEVKTFKRIIAATRDFCLAPLV